jgi:sigma-E factor negative regulatory protein RseB
VQHLVYSDGLASVSVFIEPRNPQTEAIRGLAKVGAAFAYSRDLEGHQVTAVGEVPAATVQAIAAGVMKESDAAASALTRDPGTAPR